ncbi:MAG TPA: cupin domain-containing protein [Methylomirabilota bacterium]|jgi:quercetin dioxygenase-like cupin family protein|nr:cupin domain-containing protein [Methylomirabilota bacterium]
MTIESRVLAFATLPVFERGGGVQTMLFSSKELGAHITSGVTRFPAGGSIPLHYHNCDEQTTVLEGEAEAEIDGRRVRMRPYDTAFIPQGRHHRFRNVGTGPMMILWVYNITDVTRTFVETGETVPHLSPRDLAASRPPAGPTDRPERRA